MPKLTQDTGKTIKKMRGNLFPWLQIIRLPNIFTSQSNVLAALLVAGLSISTTTALLLLAASTCLYAGGIVLNDWFDEAIDKVERPFRPLPSGKIKKQHALIFVFFSLITGMLLCMAVSLQTGIIASLLVLCIVAYDGLLKNVVLAGAVIMALCRALNWYLGLAQGAPPLSPLLFILPVFLFVLLIMSLSKHETADRIPWQYWIPAGIFFSLFAMVIGYISMHGQWGKYGILAGIFFCTILLTKTIHIVATSPPEIIARKIVGFLILGFIPLDALLVYLVRGWKESLLVLFLLLPAWLSSRFFYTT